MAYIMVKYQDPTTYALVDLDESQVEIIDRALQELVSFYERLKATPDELQPIETLIAVIDRRFRH